MFRKDLVDLLRDRPMSVAEIARHMRVAPGEVEHDLQHLLRTLKHSEDVLVVTPAQCRKCGFVFEEAKLTKPSKCPRVAGLGSPLPCCVSNCASEPVTGLP